MPSYDRPGLIHHRAEHVEDPGVNVVSTDHAPIVALATATSTLLPILPTWPGAGSGPSRSNTRAEA